MRTTAVLLGMLGCLVAGSVSAADAGVYRDLFEMSQKEKRGLTFYVNGQTIPGIVTKMPDESSVEVRNQAHGRIVIRLDRVDAVAAP